jgi:hypothetical protein
MCGLVCGSKASRSRPTSTGSSWVVSPSSSLGILRTPLPRRIAGGSDRYSQRSCIHSCEARAAVSTDAIADARARRGCIRACAWVSSPAGYRHCSTGASLARSLWTALLGSPLCRQGSCECCRRRRRVRSPRALHTAVAVDAPSADDAGAFHRDAFHYNAFHRERYVSSSARWGHMRRTYVVSCCAGHRLARSTRDASTRCCITSDPARLAIRERAFGTTLRSASRASRCRPTHDASAVCTVWSGSLDMRRIYGVSSRCVSVSS